MIRTNTGLLSAAIFVALAVIPHAAEARLIGKRDSAKTEATAVALRSAQPELLPPGGPVVSACKPCITYRDRGCRDICCGCEPPMQTVLLVKDPVTCCCVEVPICLPPCCTDAPKVCGREGLFGRGIVDYDWCCGFSVKVTFRARGDIVVTYTGR
jgi:hypothetical protein